MCFLTQTSLTRSYDFHPMSLSLHFHLKSSPNPSAFSRVYSHSPVFQLQFHFAKKNPQKTSPHLSPQAFQDGSQDWSVGVAGGCLVAKWLSHFPQTFFSGHWLDNYVFNFLNMSHSESSCIRILQTWLSSTKYTPTMCTFLTKKWRSPDKIQNWASFKCLGQPSYLANMPYYFICTQYMFRITEHWSKLIEISKFWLPCTENKCSAWHLNKKHYYFINSQTQCPINF